MKRLIKSTLSLALFTYLILVCFNQTSVKAVNTYTVSFNSQGGSSVASKVVPYNGTIIAPTAPTKTFFKFNGWYKEPGCIKPWNFSTDKVIANTNLYAKWISLVPSNVVAKSSMSKNIVISWIGVGGATGYEVWRSTSSTGTFALVTTVSGTSYVNTGLVSEGTYYYKIRPYVTVGTKKVYGNFSAMAVGKSTTKLSVSVLAKAVSYNSINLTWSAVTGASGYEVWRSTSSTGTYSLITATVNRSYKNTGITTGVTYYYKIRPYILVGTNKVYGDYSAVASDKAKLTLYGRDLNIVIALPLSNTSMMIAWAPVEGASGYELCRATSFAGPYTVISASGSPLYMETNLTAGTTYYYKVRSYIKVGTSTIYTSYSYVTTAKSTATPALSAPSFVLTEQDENNTAAIAWMPASEDDGYEVWRSVSSTGSYALVTSTKEAGYNDTSLKIGTTYYYKIRAYKVVGTTKQYSGFSYVSSVKLVPKETIVQATAASMSSIKTAWVPVKGASGYELWRSNVSTGGYALITTTTATSYMNTGLAIGTEYYYKVRPYIMVGTVKVYGDFSNTSGSKPTSGIPTSVLNAPIQVISSGMSIEWLPAVGASGYEVWKSKSSTGTYSLLKTTTALNYIDESVFENTTTTIPAYYYKVRAYTLVGTTKIYSDFSYVVSIETLA